MKMDNNKVTKFIRRGNKTIYQTEDVTTIRGEINIMFDNFQNTTIRELLKSDQPLFEKFFPDASESTENFPMIMINPAFNKEYSISFDPSDFEGNETLIQNITNEVEIMESKILEYWDSEVERVFFSKKGE